MIKKQEEGRRTPVRPADKISMQVIISRTQKSIKLVKICLRYRSAFMDDRLIKVAPDDGILIIDANSIPLAS